MDIQQAIQYALEGNAILFTGAGFSYGALNINDKKFITGLSLRDHLAEECGITNTQSSLSSVADYHINYHKGYQTIIETLTRLFSVKEITNAHKDIMSVKWKRVYTTNYDEIAEFAAAQNGIFLKPVTLSSECRNPATQNVCVHLNGYIKNLSEQTLMKEFKLSDTSYDAETLRGKPWFDFMEKDFLSAKAIFVVGFSLSGDIDISRLLAVPTISSKIIFINKPNMDPIDKNVLEKYAPVYEIGIDSFANSILEEKKNYVPSPMMGIQFESFIYEHMHTEAPSVVNLQDLTHFYSLGKINSSLFSRDGFGDYKYIAPRKALNMLLKNINNKKVFLAISTLGNGKTVFCNMVRYALSQVDVNVFFLSKQLVDIEFEISEICKCKKRSIVIIDDYYKHLDILKCFNLYGCENVAFVLTSRQSKLATNYRKLVNALNIQENEIQPLYLYSLVDDEPRFLANVLSENKVLPEKIGSKSVDNITEYFKSNCNCSIANIVLDFYNNHSIRNELTTLIQTATSEENSDIHDLCVLALCSSVMNLGLTFSDMLFLLKVDYLRLSYKMSPLLEELFNINNDSIEITSSIIAKSLLYTIISPSSLTEVLIKVVTEANRLYNHDSKYRELLKAILSHTNYEPLIRNDSANLSHVMNFYNRIRNLDFCKNNPFYWEQFASICIEAKDYVTANQCIQSAYTCAKQISGFTPFQIATIHGELILEELQNELHTSVVDVDNCVDRLTEAHALFLKYYSHPENNHYHIFSCTQSYLSIFSLVKEKMSTRHISIYIEKLTDILNRMTEYQKSPESGLYPNTHKWSTEISNSIDEAKQQLKRKQ